MDEFPLVVVLDDEKDIVGLVMYMLANDGWSVVGFCESNEALRFMKRNRDRVKFQVIDIEIPLLNGLEYVKELTRVAIRVPTVFMTGNFEEVGLPDWCVRIEKPFGAQQLKDAIKLVLERR